MVMKRRNRSLRFTVSALIRPSFVRFESILRTLERTLNDVDRLTGIVPLAAALLDAFVPGEFGGTGVTVDPAILQQYAMRQRPRLILSGGLNPDNVASLADHAAVWGIDTASGVESSAGIKDAARVCKFVNAARDSGNRHGRPAPECANVIDGILRCRCFWYGCVGE